MVVPLTPASGADIAGRIVGRQLQDMWKQTVLIDNRPGAGGQIGTQIVVRATPDGHTLLVQSSSHTVNPAIYKNLPYDSLKDLADVASLGSTPYVMITAPERPVSAAESADRRGQARNPARSRSPRRASGRPRTSPASISRRPPA